MENKNFYDVNVIQEQRMNSIKQMMSEKPESQLGKSAFRKMEGEDQSDESIASSQSLASKDAKSEEANDLSNLAFEQRKEDIKN